MSTRSPNARHAAEPSAAHQSEVIFIDSASGSNTVLNLFIEGEAVDSIPEQIADESAGTGVPAGGDMFGGAIDAPAMTFADYLKAGRLSDAVEMLANDATADPGRLWGIGGLAGAGVSCFRNDSIPAHQTAQAGAHQSRKSRLPTPLQAMKILGITSTETPDDPTQNPRNRRELAAGGPR